MSTKSNTANEGQVIGIIAEVMELPTTEVTRDKFFLVQITPTFQQAAKIWKHLRDKFGVPVPDDCISLSQFRIVGDLIDYAEGRGRSRRVDSPDGLALLSLFLNQN